MDNCLDRAIYFPCDSAHDSSSNGALGSAIYQGVVKRQCQGGSRRKLSQSWY